jgi:hypothetical protein
MAAKSLFGVPLRGKMKNKPDVFLSLLLVDSCLHSKVKSRFLSFVQKSSGCWLWRGRINPKGYGRLLCGGDVNIFAHRVSYTLFKGVAPGKLCVLHDCPGGDNSRCVNPAHLWLGTRADNNADIDLKGRRNAPKGNKHWSRKYPERVARGEKKSSLSVRHVHVIRSLYKRGFPQPFLGRMFGVNRTTIGQIVRGHTWRHV